MKRYQWEILQHGELPLRPDGRIDQTADHLCTSVLLWPEGESLTPENTLITDPCFAGERAADALLRLQEIGFDRLTIGRYFVTHPHHDHMPFLNFAFPLKGNPFSQNPLEDMRLIACPGHHPQLQALCFRDGQDQNIWIVSDAVLDREWLLAWNYYYPNGYFSDEIITTWRSVAQICAGADLIVPGHGEPIVVTADLLHELIAGFPRAKHAEDCPDVIEMLKRQVANFKK